MTVLRQYVSYHNLIIMVWSQAKEDGSRMSTPRFYVPSNV